MKNSLVRKGLVFVIILLFIGIGIQPVYAAQKKERFDVKAYDVNIDLCGLGKSYAVQLTEQQLIEVDVLFESIKDDLDNVKTQEETIRIYSDAIVKLDRYGLFGDYSIKQVQKLIIGKYQKSINNHILNRLYKNKQSSDENVFCLICGHTNETFFMPMSTMLVIRLFPIMTTGPLSFALFMVGFMLRLLIVEQLLKEYNFNNPVALGNGIMFGTNDNAASGWVYTHGLFGGKNWTGELYGLLLILQVWQFSYRYFGATGFTGIKIIKRPIDYSSGDLLDYYYLGFANHVHLGTEEP